MERRLRELLDHFFETQKSEPCSEEEQLELQKELIDIATKLYPHLSLNFGNSDTGEMNAENLKILHQKVTNLKKLFEQVYTFDGEVYPCGRQKCMKLIEAASELYPNTYFGDINTGKMNFWKLLELRHSMFIEYEDA